MGLNSHLNWDRYRRELAGIVDEEPHLAVPVVKRDFVGLHNELTVIRQEASIEEADDVLRRIEYDLATAEIKEFERKYFSDEEAAIIEIIADAPPIPAEIYLDMQDEFDLDWVSLYDYEKVEDIRERGFEVVLEEYNDSHRDRRHFDQRTITFPSYEAAVVWMNEITGQISDGAWENAPQTQYDEWQNWVYAQIQVNTNYVEAHLEGPELPGMDFGPYGKLGEYESMFGRMVYYVRASGVNPEYTVTDLKSDLKAINAGL